MVGCMCRRPSSVTCSKTFRYGEYIVMKPIRESKKTYHRSYTIAKDGTVQFANSDRLATDAR